MIELKSLRDGLSSLNSRLIEQRLVLPPGPIGKTAAELERKHGEGRSPDREIVLRALRKYLQTGELTTFADVKSTCFGLLMRADGKHSVVGRPERFHALLETVDHLSSNSRKLQRCFQALLGAYFEFDGVDPTSPMHPQWTMLRTHLENWLPTLRRIVPQPPWLSIADDHRNLLSVDPTRRYGPKLLQGDRSEFEQVCRGLEIKESSWVLWRAIISTIDAGTAADDKQFASHLNKLITLIADHKLVRVEGAVKLLDRYAQMASRPEQATLRMFAVEVFGNPLVVANRQRWANASPAARDMVAGWLKGFLIERFFELLTQDGHSDRRRPKFWQSYRNSIEGMWFVLGTNARSNVNVDFKKLRETMGDHCLALEGGSAVNNAFIMKLGHLYVVEFGQHGNATYIFNGSDLPFDLSRKSLSLTAHLKNQKHVDRLTHMDGHETWETKFANSLFRLATLRPDSAAPQRRHAEPASRPIPSAPRPSASSATESRATASSQSASRSSLDADLDRKLRMFCAQKSLTIEDLRPFGGSLIVHTDLGSAVVNATLSSWGFTYDADSSLWSRR